MVRTDKLLGAGAASEPERIPSSATREFDADENIEPDDTATVEGSSSSDSTSIVWYHPETNQSTTGCFW